MATASNQLIDLGYLGNDKVLAPQEVLDQLRASGKAKSIVTTTELMQKGLKPKRQPLLCDILLASPAVAAFIGKKQGAVLKANLLEAKRFVLDEAASRFVAEMIRDHPRIIADAQDFAIPPFKKVWIELPFDPFFYTINADGEKDDTRDLRIGYLIIGNEVYGGVHAMDHGQFHGSWMPTKYRLWKPMTDAEERKMMETFHVSRAGLDKVYWGSVYTKLITESDQAGVRALRANHGMELLLDPSLLEEEYKEAVHGIFNEISGDLRNIIALLLFLNRTRDIQRVDDVPFKQAMIGGKAGVLLKHSVITISVNPEPRIKKMVAGHSVWRRLHDVKGHFCHDEKARAGCLHGAESPDLKDFGDFWIEYEPLRWKCERCGGKRWWRHEHKRGHEEKGLVTSEYKVTE